MDKNNLEKLRHSCSHLLAAAIMELWPKTKRAIGPAIDNGFYFDFEFINPISETDFPRIEQKMHEIVKKWDKFEKQELTLDEAKADYPDNPYKHELIDEYAKQDAKLSFYQSGDYRDLCVGSHIDNPSKALKHFKLLSIAGAYWRGSEKNKMLTRIYGTCFPTKEELDKYLWLIEEAKKRDHRKLGRELDLFVISENIGKGLPLLTPNGTVIKKQILDYEYKLETAAGFKQVSTPHIARSEMYKKTGHWDHYRDTMYKPFGIDEDEYVLKPMNCPHHYMIYASQPRSYKDLPIRLSEPGMCYRFEKAGELAGLLRVRALSIDDSHILMMENQIESEFALCIRMVKQMFTVFQLPDYYVRLSLADPTDAVKYIADEQTWTKAGEKLEKIVKDNKLNYVVKKGEASFYGPKLDFMVKDSLGREWQMSTLQLDLFMSKRLNLVYTDDEGKEKNPVILHRGLTGSIERTLAILIEHFNGSFPIWLAPVQVAILPISEKHLEYAQTILAQLQSAGIRTEVDRDNKKIGYKIRQATLKKIPYMIIIGDKESQNNKEMLISVRQRDGKNMGTMNITSFLDILKDQIEKFL